MTAKDKYFGFEKTSAQEKNERVQDVFNRVAYHYDLMNDLMSLGLHRWWKKIFSLTAQLRSDENVLDIATGTGDIALLLLPYLKNSQKQMVISDRNEVMLKKAQKRIWSEGYLCQSILCNAEKLPFNANSFQMTSISFGLRNVTNKEIALSEMYRVLAPKGRVMILEFSHPATWLRPIYDFYSWKIIPWLGKMVVKDKESYQYLIESIRVHPTQEELKLMMANVGFQSVSYHNFHTGIVALHIGYK